jgi:alkylhydroperoxidase/carboxymuconolactone decarboxylase family protein YurZ
LLVPKRQASGDRGANNRAINPDDQEASMTTSAPLPTTPLCDRLRATGEWNPAWNAFYDLDPEWTERFMAMGVLPMLRGVLNAKTVEFIAIAVDASCTHMYSPGVRRHIRKALELGATKQEIAAVLQLTSVLGIHTLSLGAPILHEELAACERVAEPAL